MTEQTYSLAWVSTNQGTGEKWEVRSFLIGILHQLFEMTYEYEHPWFHYLIISSQIKKKGTNNSKSWISLLAHRFLNLIQNIHLTNNSSLLRLLNSTPLQDVDLKGLSSSMPSMSTGLESPKMKFNDLGFKILFQLSVCEY